MAFKRSAATSTAGASIGTTSEAGVDGLESGTLAVSSTSESRELARRFAIDVLQENRLPVMSKATSTVCLPKPRCAASLELSRSLLAYNRNVSHQKQECTSVLFVFTEVRLRGTAFGGLPRRRGAGVLSTSHLPID